MEWKLESVTDTASSTDMKVEIVITRKYQLRGYTLGVLTYTTAWDRLWGGDEH